MSASGPDGSLALVKLLVEYGADVNAESSRGTSALSMAILHEKKDVAEYLIQHGARGDFSIRRITSIGETVETINIGGCSGNQHSWDATGAECSECGKTRDLTGRTVVADVPRYSMH